jgi:hypothetical protein
MQLSMRMGRHQILLDCDRHFEQAGRSVLLKLSELDQRGPALGDGSKVQFGWSVLTLRLEQENLRIYEPDYFGDALHGLRPTLDTTLEVITEQAEVLRRERVEGLDARFDHYVLAWPGALAAREIFLSRRSDRQPDDTGWFIGDLALLDSGATDKVLEALRVFELLKLRRSVMQVLALPPGYAVVMRGGEIDSMAKGE